MRAIIHSIHSQVPRTIAKMNRPFDVILSLDSHLDISLGGDDRIYPKELRMIARRTGAHTAMREIGGPRPPSKMRVIVVIPQRMLARHAVDIESNLPRPLRILDADESITSVVDFLEKKRGIEVFQSPPESLLELVRHVKKARSWLLDIDVDYMQEMQNECYTRIINPKPGVLQSKGRVVDFLHASKPEIVTISEAKVSAIRDPRSVFSNFVSELKKMGYEIEEEHIAANDAEVMKGISVCKEFYRTVSKKLMVTHMDEMMNNDFEVYRRAERVAAKRFFEEKGYVD
jgi:hypothetical protein